MTETERQEFKQMATDVALLKHSQEKIVEPALVSINRKLDALSFYTKEETDKKLIEFEKDIDDKLATVQKRRWYENALSALMGAILASIIITFVNRTLGQ